MEDPEKTESKKLPVGNRFHRESYRSFVTAMLQDNMIDFNRDFQVYPSDPISSNALQPHNIAIYTNEHVLIISLY